MSSDEALQTLQQLAPTLGLVDFTRAALKLIRDQVGVDRGTLFVVDRERDEIRSIIADGVVGGISLPIGFGIAGSVAETREIVDTYNPYEDDRFDGKYEAILKYDTKDIFCMPVIDDKNNVVGVLELLNRSRPFTSEDREFLDKLSRQIAPALQNSSTPR
jgi:GAF domain-containing protein